MAVVPVTVQLPATQLTVIVPIDMPALVDVMSVLQVQFLETAAPAILHPLPTEVPVMT